jgi:hypothetical protein
LKPAPLWAGAGEDTSSKSYTKAPSILPLVEVSPTG